MSVSGLLFEPRKTYLDRARRLRSTHSKSPRTARSLVVPSGCGRPRDPPSRVLGLPGSSASPAPRGGPAVRAALGDDAEPGAGRGRREGGPTPGAPWFPRLRPVGASPVRARGRAGGLVRSLRRSPWPQGPPGRLPAPGPRALAHPRKGRRRGREPGAGGASIHLPRTRVAPAGGPALGLGVGSRASHSGRPDPGGLRASWWRSLKNNPVWPPGKWVRVSEATTEGGFRSAPKLIIVTLKSIYSQLLSTVGGNSHRYSYASCKDNNY